MGRTSIEETVTWIALGQSVQQVWYQPLSGVRSCQAPGQYVQGVFCWGLVWGDMLA